MIQVIAEHSVDNKLLTHNGNILDLGCRGFDFEYQLDCMGDFNIHCIDIDELEGDYFRLAISDKNGMCAVNHTGDKQATHIKEGNEIPMMTIETFSKMVNVKHWDLIKMDIEGEEIKVLESAKHPMAIQVSVEFHAHCGVQTKEQLDALLDKLSEYYTIHNRVWEQRHGCSHNYWDVLLIAK